MCPPSSSSPLLARKTITSAFHLIKDLILLSINKSPGMAASSLVGMVFLKGVVRLYVGTSPVAVSFFANSVKRNDALSVPAFCITESIASIHS